MTLDTSMLVWSPGDTVLEVGQRTGERASPPKCSADNHKAPRLKAQGGRAISSQKALAGQQ